MGRLRTFEGETMNEIYKYASGFLVGVFFTFLVFIPFTRSRVTTINELETKLVESQGLVVDLRTDNQILAGRQQQLTNNLTNSINRITELEDRNNELTELVDRTGKDIARAVNDAESLTSLIERIIDTVESLVTDN